MAKSAPLSNYLLLVCYIQLINICLIGEAFFVGKPAPDLKTESSGATKLNPSPVEIVASQSNQTDIKQPNPAANLSTSNNADKTVSMNKRNKEAFSKKQDTKMFDYSDKGAACQQAISVVRDTIEEWENLIGKLRLSLKKGQINVSPMNLQRIEKHLKTLQGHVDGAREALAKGNLKEMNNRSRMGGFELAKLSFIKEAGIMEPRLTASAKNGRLIYKNYRQACGGPAY